MLLKPLLLNGKSAVDESSWIATLSSSSYDSYGRSIVVSPDGKYIYICGQSIGYFSETNQYRMSGLIAKYDSSGNLQWQRTLAFIEPIIFNSIVISPDGNSIYVCGTNTNGVIGLDDIIIAKYNSSGDLLWQKLCGIMDEDRGSYISISPDGNYIYICGRTKSTDTNKDSCFIAKYNSSGEIQWQRTNSVSDGTAITVSPDNNSVYICASSDSPVDINDWSYLIKYDQYGEMQWNKVHKSFFSIYDNSITFSPDGNYIYTCGSCRRGMNGRNSIYLAKYDTSGNLQWMIEYETSTNFGEGTSVSVSPDGNYIYICGYISQSSSQYYDCFIAKYNSSGEIQYQRTLSDVSHDYGYSINVSPNGKAIYICGDYISSTHISECFVAKITEDIIKQGTVSFGDFTLSESSYVFNKTAPTMSTYSLTSTESSLSSIDAILESHDSTLVPNLYN